MSPWRGVRAGTHITQESHKRLYTDDPETRREAKLRTVSDLDAQTGPSDRRSVQPRAAEFAGAGETFGGVDMPRHTKAELESRQKAAALTAFDSGRPHQSYSRAVSLTRMPSSSRCTSRSAGSAYTR